MLTKKILILWGCGVAVLMYWFACNYPLALGYDHGAYNHLINLLENGENLASVPVYLQGQFEPFSGTFFYSMRAFLGSEILFTWGYLAVYLGISGSLFLLGKYGRFYTIGSYIGLVFFLFSVIQYADLWWSFGKQMFATFFALLLIRYWRKAPLMIILLTACISLHRLTGFVAILYVFTMSFFTFQKKMTEYLPVLVGLILAFSTYITTFGNHLQPIVLSMWHDFSDFILISGSSGTGFSSDQFWFYETPIMLMVVLGVSAYILRNGTRSILNKPQIIVAIIIGIMVLFRTIAFTRLGAFFDIALIIIITQLLYPYIHKYWIVIFLVVQICTWGMLAGRGHAPFIDREEQEIIRTAVKIIPHDASVVALSGAYMSWMTGEIDQEIYSLYQGVSSDIWTSEEKENMQYDREFLCQKLGYILGDVYLFAGSREPFISTRENSCLDNVIQWDNGSRLMRYSPIK